MSGVGLNSWPEYKLGDLADEITVGFVGPMSAEYVTEGIPFLRSLNIKPFWVDPTDMLRISRKFHERINKSRLSPGDVVIVRTGAPGTATVIPDWLKEANCADLVVIRPGPNLDPWFLASFLNSYAKVQVDAFLVGAVQQHFNIGSAKELRICAPSIKEQQKIARVVQSIQEKIELNRRMNHTLESIAAALFKSWFVDFDPVVAKAAGRKPYGIDDATAALFPDSFEESELGPLPRGWKIVELNQVASLIKGRSYASSELSESATALVTLKSFQRGGGYRPDGLKGFTGRYHKEQVVVAGELVVAVTDVTQAAEVIGRATIVRSDRKYERLVASLDAIIVRPVVDALSPLFLCELLRSRDYLDHISGYTNGTTVLHLDLEGLRRYLFTMPEPNVLKAFESFARGVFQRNTTNEAEGECLAQLRDRLLPELISGEIRLTDAETQVSEAL